MVILSKSLTTASAVIEAYGGITWIEIDNGRFIEACGTNGSTGNAAAVDTGASTGSTGTPSNNSTGAASGNTGDTTLTINQIPKHTHYYASAQRGGAASYEGNNTSSILGKRIETESKGGGQSHNHSLNSHTHTLNNHTHSLNSHTHTAGSPLAYKLHIWERTA